jgi:hypothetical protein
LQNCYRNKNAAAAQRIYSRLHGYSAALLRSHSFSPLIRFWVGRLRLDDGIAHDTTMPRQPVRQEERFMRRLVRQPKLAGNS